MKIIVKSQEEGQAIIDMCGAACKTGNLNIAKTAVIIAEAVEKGFKDDSKDNKKLDDEEEPTGEIPKGDKDDDSGN